MAALRPAVKSQADFRLSKRSDTPAAYAQLRVENRGLYRRSPLLRVDQRNHAAGMPLEAAGKIELQQDHEDLRRMQSGVANDLVYPGRRWAERLQDFCAIVVAWR